jgi:hypothetical protein
MGYAPGLTFLGTVKLRVLWVLAEVLVYVSTIKINLRRNKRIHWDQFAVTVGEINRVYMQCKIFMVTIG